MTTPKDVISRVVPPAPPGLHMIMGPTEMQNMVLFSLAKRLEAGTTIYWIDAGNRFDAYGLGNAARAAQLDERTVLSHVQIARPFTAIQLTAMLANKLPMISPMCPVIIADPMALFYDHEMQEEELNRILRNFIEVVDKLHRPVLALTVYRQVPPGRGGLSRRLLKHVQTIARYQPMEAIE